MARHDEGEERRKRFAQVWSLSRQDAGRTQEEMAKGLGISKKTVQNWENGVTFPDLYTGCEWFRVLGMNPLPYYLAYLFPDFFDGIDPEDEDYQEPMPEEDDEERLERTFTMFIMEDL